jgi:hypothetical protein
MFRSGLFPELKPLLTFFFLLFFAWHEQSIKLTGYGYFWGTHPKGKISGLIPMAYQLILASATRFPVPKQFVFQTI